MKALKALKGEMPHGIKLAVQINLTELRFRLTGTDIH